jgi:type I restriction-modification system DNA methylase subunit
MIDFKLPYSENEFLTFLEGFLPEDYVFQNEELTIPFQSKYFEKVIYKGESSTLNVAVYEIYHNSERDARVSLTREIFRLMASYSKRRSLVILIPKNAKNYRFSLVTISLKFEDDRVKRTYSNPKRYSFILGENAKIHTPHKLLVAQGRVADFEDLQKRFSVEVVNKEFYNTLFEWFQWAVREVTYPTGKNEEELIRFISRMMFVWFLKQMKLVPDILFDKDGASKFLNDLSENETTYYKAILQNLFFATLNTTMRKDLSGNQAHVREFLPYGTMTNKRGLQYYYRYSRMLKNPVQFQTTVDGVPFLNGGLFECLDERKNETGKDDIWIDAFTQSVNSQHLLHFPNKLFFEPEKGLLDIFNRYNFTVEESSPVDMNVGLDPEMLGSVFENLLAAYNPETRDSARRETASFYTPKQVVDYMTTATLKEYLNENIKGIERDKLYHLFDYTCEGNPFDITQTRRIVEALDNVKILDPACGSGAFPMGILNSIVHALNKIDPENELWKNRQIEKVMKDQPDYKQRREEIDRIFNQSNSETNFARKLFLIENAINGVDIQPIAIQISKLRFFLSLVIEQEIDNNKSNLGIIPLPNLETRFVCADSLLKLKKPSKLNIKIRKASTNLFGEVIPYQANLFTEQSDLPHKKIEKDLKEVRHRYFEAKTIETKRKYRELDYELRTKLSKQLTELGYPGNESKKIADWNPYDKSKVTDWFEPEFMFGIDEGFDIIIGNPPYIQLQNDGGKLAEKYQPIGYQTFTRTGDIYCLFYERGNELLKDGGNLCLITSNKWMRAGYGEKLRKYFSDNTDPLTLIDMGPGVFDAATVDTNILLFKRGKTIRYRLLACILPRNFKKLNVSISDYFKVNHTVTQNISSDIWNIHSKYEENIEEKIKKYGKPLSEWNLKVNFGIKTGYNPAFIIDGNTKNYLLAADQKNEEIIKPLLRGRDTQRYIADFNDNWLIATFPSLHINIDEFPAVRNYLESFGRRLEQSGESYVDNSATLQNCRKRTSHQWFETQDNIAFFPEFEKEKVVWKRIGSIMRFSYDTENMYCLDSTCIATGEKIKYLVGLLNSKLCLYELFQTAPKTGTGDMIISVQALEPLCVYYPDERIEKIITDMVDMILQYKRTGQETIHLENQIDLMVYKLYKLTYDEVMIVDPDIESLITREEYENMDIEELSQRDFV